MRDCVVKNSLLVVCLFAMSIIIGCGDRNQSSCEGRVIDASGRNLTGTTVTAHQIQPLKGFETCTGTVRHDGTFNIGGLYPESKYIIEFGTDIWTTSTRMSITSAPVGETSILRTPIVIRFRKSSGGVIHDSKTGLNWIVGPDSIGIDDAKRWISASGRRWPTLSELEELRIVGSSENWLDPVFGTNNRRAWLERSGEETAFCYCYACDRLESFFVRCDWGIPCVLAVSET